MLVVDIVAAIPLAAVVFCPHVVEIVVIFTDAVYTGLQEIHIELRVLSVPTPEFDWTNVLT